MKTGKKVLGAVLAAAMALSSITPVFAADKVKITFMSRDSGDTPMAKVYEDQIAAFMEENPDIEVQNDSVYEESAYNNKLKVALSTGETPNIFYYPAIAGLKEWAQNGVLLDLTDSLNEDEEWKNTFLDGALDTYDLSAYGVDGIYALPNELNVDAIFYNKALFEKAGIEKTPETMDELYEDIDKLVAAGITPFGVGGKNTWVMGHIFNNILAKRIGRDGIIKLGTGEKKWTDDDVVECLQITKDLKDKGVFLLNLMSSPGAGKTTTLKRTIGMLKDEMQIGVMEADIDSDVDAQAISDTGVRAIQIHTGGMCHLDADMTRQGIREFGTKDLDFVVLENVGNLVCPAEFDTGSTKNAMILSVPEGDDKPLKYPLMFSICDVVLINKCDTLCVFDDFSKEAVEERIKKLNPDAKVIFISAKTGEGFEEWVDWIRNEIQEYKNN